MTSSSAEPGARQVMGRPRVTSRDALERLAFELFARQGFDKTTVDDIAAAAGIGRRTLFRYFASKNDLVWGDFDRQLRKLRTLLAGADPRTPILEAVRAAVVEFNRFDPEEVPWHRQRMELILTVPTLQADSTLRYTAWRDIIEEFVARRTGLPATATPVRLAGNVLLSAAVTAYEQWLSSPDVALPDLLNETIRQVGAGLAETLENAS